MLDGSAITTSLQHQIGRVKPELTKVLVQQDHFFCRQDLIHFPVSAKISVIINFDFRYFCRYQDDLKLFYYRGLKEWGREKGYLMDTCLTAQDRYKAYLDYFRIAYDG